ncbi:FAD-dependent monooxygenase [Actinomycetospora soli]|uniref:FAD-dependent monooxygenase n=1 Tax=Actinomycetospora soli TaxID=2893887 RepID=UPI001E508356|nr:FAD-dependent monooxygenase [Actinomycetospora soli]MCD2186659.1 FAD-dependent monooxygenase [Actinomycetospora soli]
MIDVLIVGAGPTGTMLAAELRLHGVHVVVLEKRASPTWRAGGLGLHVRSVEILDQRGLLERFDAEATRFSVGGPFAGLPLPWPDDLDTAHPYGLAIRQERIERLLTEHALELGADVRRGVELTGLHQDDDAVTAVLADGSTLRARYLVGADGGRSTVRAALGVGFHGEPSTADTYLADVELTEDPTPVVTALRSRHLRFGVVPLGGGVHRVILPAATVSDGGPPPTFEAFRDRLRTVAGTDLGVHSPRGVSRFGTGDRLADTYRVDRVFLAGDAAHVHPPTGGQGLNLGLQDAIGLGWALAAAVAGWAPDGLLDTYGAERRAVAEGVVVSCRAMVALLREDPQTAALRTLLTEVGQLPGVSRHLTDRIAATGIRYDLGSPDDRVGRRMPDVAVGDGRLYPHLHRARGLLLDRTGLSVGAWCGRVDRLPDDGSGPDSLLLRPDGHVAWAGADQHDLDAHLARWFGAP